MFQMVKWWKPFRFVAARKLIEIRSVVVDEAHFCRLRAPDSGARVRWRNYTCKCRLDSMWLARVFRFNDHRSPLTNISPLSCFVPFGVLLDLKINVLHRLCTTDPLHQSRIGSHYRWTSGIREFLDRLPFQFIVLFWWETQYYNSPWRLYSIPSNPCAKYPPWPIPIDTVSFVMPADYSRPISLCSVLMSCVDTVCHLLLIINK